MARYLVVAAMVWDIAYSKRKWLQQQIAGWGRARVWKKHSGTLHYCRVTESQSGLGTDGGGTSPGSAKRQTCAEHPSNTLHTPPARRRRWRNRRGEQGMGVVSTAAVVSDRALSLSPPCPSLPGESDAGLRPPPGHEHHHKVLMRETWQADEETDANTTAPLP